MPPSRPYHLYPTWWLNPDFCWFNPFWLQIQFHHCRIHTYIMLKSSFITRTDTCIHPYLCWSKSEISVVHYHRGSSMFHPCSIHLVKQYPFSMFSPPRFRWTGDANLLRTAPWQKGGMSPGRQEGLNPRWTFFWRYIDLEWSRFNGRSPGS